MQERQWRLKVIEVDRQGLNENVSTEQNTKLWEQKYMQISRQRDLQKRDKKTNINSNNKTTYPEEVAWSRSGMFSNNKEGNMTGAPGEERAVEEPEVKEATSGKTQYKLFCITYFL